MPAWSGAGSRRAEQFADARSELIERLRDIREDATEAMNEAARDLSVRRSEYDALLQGRARLAQRFAQHQNQIEQTGRALLEIYREANRKARTTPAPDYFAKAVHHGAHRLCRDAEYGRARQSAQMIAETQELLNRADQGDPRGVRRRGAHLSRNRRTVAGEAREETWLGGARGSARPAVSAGRVLAASCCCCSRSARAARSPISISRRPARPVLDAQSLCPVSGPQGITVVLVDTSDDLPETDTARGSGPARRHDHDACRRSTGSTSACSISRADAAVRCSRNAIPATARA